MADFTEVTRRMEEFGLASPTSKSSPPFRPAPIVTDDPRFTQRTLSLSSNISDITTPSNSGKSTPINRKLSTTRSIEEMFLMESPSASVDATASPMSRSRATPPTSPYVSQRDMHPLTRKFTGELGIASEVSKIIEKADFSDDDEESDGEEDDVIVLTDGEDNHHQNTSLLLDSSFDISPKGRSGEGSNCSSNNSSFNDQNVIPIGSHSHHDDDDEPFEFLKADH